MKIEHIHAYKVFHDFDIDFCHAGKSQNLIVLTGVNGNGKTTLLRDVIAGTDVADKPKSNITIESNGKVETFSLPDASGNKAYKEAFSQGDFL